MIDFRIPVVAAIALGAGPWLFWMGFRKLRVLQLIENTPTARIRSMAMGLVEVHGTVSTRSELNGPFSRRACAYWEVDISVRARQRNSWSVIHRNSSGQPFYLSDDTGTAMVYPKGAECRLNFGTEEECFGLMPPSPYAEYLHQHSSVVTRVTRLGMLRFRERMLEEGQEVYLLGTATPRSQALVISDGEGMADGTYDALGASRLRERDREVSAVIRRGENESTFIISQVQERDLVTGLKLKAGAMILGGPPIALFGLGYWLMALAMRRMPG